MTAYGGNTTAQSTWPGSTAQSEFYGLVTAFLSGNAAASRPANIAAGGMWSKDLGGGAYELYLYDGTDNQLIQAASGPFAIGEDGGGDSRMTFYDDTNDVTRSFGWDDSAGQFVLEADDDTEYAVVYNGPTQTLTGDWTWSSGSVTVGTLSGLNMTTATGVGCVAGTEQFAARRTDAPALDLARTGSDGAIQRFYRNSSSVGNISVTTSATAYNTSSDYRLKENLRSISDALGLIGSVPVYLVDFIGTGDTDIPAFIAHELQAVVPNAVTGEKDADEMQSVDHSKLVPILWQAVKDLAARVDALEAGA